MIDYAICRELPRSFKDCVTAVDNTTSPIDISLAFKQHEAYVEVLKKHVRQLVEVPADEAHPDCCFVEDTCVVVKDTAVLNRLGHTTRQKEIQGVEQALKKVPSIKTIVHMSSQDERATVDGGDCMLVGDHLYVGLSARTNRQGADVLKKAFIGVCKVVILDTLQHSETLHLKCLVSPLNADTLVMCSTEAGKALMNEIKEKSEINYNAIEVPDQVPANILALGPDFVIIQKNFPESENILKEELVKRGYQFEALDMSELIKADGALTCCSVLIP